MADQVVAVNFTHEQHQQEREGIYVLNNIEEYTQVPKESSMVNYTDQQCNSNLPVAPPGKSSNHVNQQTLDDADHSHNVTQMHRVIVDQNETSLTDNTLKNKASTVLKNTHLAVSKNLQSGTATVVDNFVQRIDGNTMNCEGNMLKAMGAQLHPTADEHHGTAATNLMQVLVYLVDPDDLVDKHNEQGNTSNGHVYTNKHSAQVSKDPNVNQQNVQRPYIPNNNPMRVSNNFERHNSNNTAAANIRNKPSHTNPNQTITQNKPSSTNLPTPPNPVIPHTLATKLRAQEAMKADDIDITPLKITTKQGYPAVVFTKEDFMVNLASDLHQNNNGPGRILTSNVTSNNYADLVPQDQPTNHVQQNHGQHHQQHTQQHKTQGFMLLGESSVPLQHNTNNNHQRKNQQQAEVYGVEEGGIQERTTNLQEGTTRGRESLLVDHRKVYRSPATTPQNASNLRIQEQQFNSQEEDELRSNNLNDIVQGNVTNIQVNKGQRQQTEVLVTEQNMGEDQTPNISMTNHSTDAQILNNKYTLSLSKKKMDAIKKKLIKEMQAGQPKNTSNEIQATPLQIHDLSNERQVLSKEDSSEDFSDEYRVTHSEDEEDHDQWEDEQQENQ
ncbi:uncharacterized protein LOC129892775 [Solanum dulcamara]|uniref:uncharacterized protein LOC129892775 n=1 Tax=Solanum dulcamara TaxID=45834 RepID=UPI002485BC9F|nr:uncharacterized protein LOC129892775 [Solanum dulcamara]